MKLLFAVLLFVFSNGLIISQPAIQGIVTDSYTNNPIIYGTIAVYKNDILITGTETDIQGIFNPKARAKRGI